MARLLFVNHTGKLGGPSHSLLKLIKYLKNEHSITVVLPENGELVGVLQHEGVFCKVFSFRYRHIPILMQWMWRNKFEAVYGNNFSRTAYIALIAAKLLRKPYVWHIREVFKDGNIKPEIYQRVRHANALIAVSKASAYWIKKHVPKKQVAVIYNGVELEDFPIDRQIARDFVQKELNVPRNCIIVTVVGAICHRKNQLHAIKAAAKVISNHSSVVFCFLGRLQEPEYVSHLKLLTEKLRINEQIHFLGFRNDVANFLRGSDLMLHVPNWDPHPRAVIEGMAAELPVVAYDIDGISETVVSMQTGYLVPFGDVSGIYQAVEKLIKNPSLKREMGARGRKRVEAIFTAKETALQVNAVINELVQR